MNEHIKYPRLYTPDALAENTENTLDKDKAHYLKTVLRLNVGDHIRLFNPQNGEWIAELSALSKKEALVIPKTQIRTPEKLTESLHLLFPPIKKNRMDFLIEKAVELGATDIHPVLTSRTQMRKINVDRINAQIIEAAEQCERLDIPTLHKLTDMDKKLAAWSETDTIACALEREKSINTVQSTASNSAFLIGPEGGFDDQERKFLLNCAVITPVSLGQRILRAETAALYCLSLASAKNAQT